MNTVASLISGQFTRSLILGSFFPVVLFLFLAYVTVDPLLPQWGWVVALHKLDRQGTVGVISVAAIVITVFVYNLNTPLVRFFEGYPWMGSGYGKKKINVWKERFEAVTGLLPRLRTLRAQWDGVNKADRKRREVQDALNRLQELLNAQYPSKANLILPTRFGNVLRSFETYALRQYAMDGVTLWPRIVSTADKDTMSAVEDARSSLDFFVNCTLLSGVLALALFALGCSVLNGSTPRGELVRWGLEVAALAGGARVFYAACPSKISAWGGEVKAVFDLFRGELLKKLGYTQTFTTREEERAVWGEISRQIIYGDPTKGVPLRYTVAEALRTAVTSESGGKLEVTGGVVKLPEEVVALEYRLVNKGEQAATKVTMTERMMAGYGYVWGSLRKNGEKWDLTGTDPYTIELGDLEAGGRMEVSFLAVALAGLTGKREETSGK